MAFDLTVAKRMARASDVAYYIGAAGGTTTCGFYGDVGFVKETPLALVSKTINAALVGTTATEVIVAFRGTLAINTKDTDGLADSILDWGNDAEAVLDERPYTTGSVHHGFADSLDQIWDQLAPAISAQVQKSGLPVVFTGHSKGGALASLGALRLEHELGISASDVYTFASPRPGNSQFARDYNVHFPDHWRVEYADDLVPHLPSGLMLLSLLAQVNPRFSHLSSRGYSPVGNLRFIDWDGVMNSGDSFVLDIKRLDHFAKLAAAGQLVKVANDHSLEKAYLPNLT